MTLILARAGGRFLRHLPFGPRLPLLTLPPLEGRGFLLGLWPRYANNGVTCLTRPEPGKIEVASPQAYLVYNLGFGVPHRTITN
ncbi:MAG: hypothetical protein F6K53_09975 [Moorea sp. SIO4A1]|uniref:hypothetical protein n=1 Tax=Moorena sp. SIO4A1 TaxID=2607835 RepID=UPI00144C236E|nr:hypothetical protein [Moorena sp. SIO4A1]NEQ57723.1 hypothetical protein [Moorena sp. SIO4A1]